MILLGIIYLSYYKSNYTRSEIKSLPVVTGRYYVDKYHIQKDYLHNIESSRLENFYLQDSTKYKYYAPYNRFHAPLGFNKYAIDWVQTKKLNPSPNYVYQRDKIYITTSVYVDALYHNADSLLCAALVVVEYPNYYKPGKIEYTAFDGYLLLGCREDKNKKFEIYTYNNLLIWDQQTKEDMSRNLREEYCRNDPKRNIPYSIESEKFFSIPFLFGKTADGDYNFQHNITSWNSIEYKLDIYSNDRTRNFYLPEDTVFIPYRSHINGFYF